MADIKITFNAGELARILKSPNGPVYQDMRRRGNNVLRKARELCPVDTGNLRRSLALEMGSENGYPIARVGSRGPVPYALWQHEGTRGGQIIRPRERQALSWTQGGQRIFAKRVRRGRTPATKFLTKALPEALR